MQGVVVVDVVVEPPPQANPPCPCRQAPEANPGPPGPPTAWSLSIRCLAKLAWAAVSLPAFWAASIWSIIACFIALVTAVGVTFRRLATSLM